MKKGKLENRIRILVIDFTDEKLKLQEKKCISIKCGQNALVLIC
jgi:hypothetical protein